MPLGPNPTIWAKNKLKPIKLSIQQWTVKLGMVLLNTGSQLMIISSTTQPSP